MAVSCPQCLLIESIFLLIWDAVAEIVPLLMKSLNLVLNTVTMLICVRRKVKNIETMNRSECEDLARVMFFLFLSQFFINKPLLGRTRSRGRCWAAIRLSHCLEQWLPIGCPWTPGVRRRIVGVHDLDMCKMKVKQRNAKLRSVVVQRIKTNWAQL